MGQALIVNQTILMLKYIEVTYLERTLEITCVHCKMKMKMPSKDNSPSTSRKVLNLIILKVCTKSVMQLSVLILHINQVGKKNLKERDMDVRRCRLHKKWIVYVKRRKLSKESWNKTKTEYSFFTEHGHANSK